MKYTIQKSKEDVIVQHKWKMIDYCKELLSKDNEYNAKALLAIEFFMECFPKFKEVTISTELSNNE
jgi:hypothetical protein